MTASFSRSVAVKVATAAVSFSANENRLAPTTSGRWFCWVSVNVTVATTLPSWLTANTAVSPLSSMSSSTAVTLKLVDSAPAVRVSS